MFYNSKRRHGSAIRCHRQNMKTSIINGSEVSRLSVAIQPRLPPVIRTCSIKTPDRNNNLFKVTHCVGPWLL
jgi:hypothetical protein